MAGGAGRSRGDAMTESARVDAASVPHLPRYVKFRFDETRQQWVLLAPERLLLPDDIAVEILQRVDGLRSVEQIVALLAEKFAAPRDEIAADVIAMLQDLVEKGYLANTPAAR
jgi:pyrroloquinoline quinone biosynthesis protein D